MGVIGSYLDRRIAAELKDRAVLVWYDPAGSWQPWIQGLVGTTSLPDHAAAFRVTLGGKETRVAISAGSHYELLQICEPLAGGSEPPRLLVYVPGEPYLESLSPLREMECAGGETGPYLRELNLVARQALQSAGLSEGKIDELL